MSRRGWVVSGTPRPYFTPGEDPVLILQEAGWAQGRSVRAENLAPLGFDPRTVQPVAQSLYRLSYPAHKYTAVQAQIHQCEKYNALYWCLYAFVSENPWGQRLGAETLFKIHIKFVIVLYLLVCVTGSGNNTQNAEKHNNSQNAEYHNNSQNAEYHNNTKNAEYHNTENAEYHNNTQNAEYHNNTDNAEYHNNTQNAEYHNNMQNITIFQPLLTDRTRGFLCPEIATRINSPCGIRGIHKYRRQPCTAQW